MPWSSPVPATTGGQQFPVHWGGDNSATFESMAENLKGWVCRWACRALDFGSHDIGGFEQNRSGRGIQAMVRLWPAFFTQSFARQVDPTVSPGCFDEESVDVPRKIHKTQVQPDAIYGIRLPLEFCEFSQDVH